MKYKVAVLLFCISCFLSVKVQAQEKKEEASAMQPSSSSLETKALMDQFLTQLTALKIYFVTEEKFLDPKNAPKIGEHLKRFVELAKQTRHNPQLNQENFKFSREVLENHIVDTERVFRLGHKTYARWQLMSTLSVCMSCHTQLPTSSTSFGEFSNLKIYSSEFDRAEFLFATRSFDKATEVYNNIIEGFPLNKATYNQVEIALQRQLAYFTRIKKDPKEGIAKMEKHFKNKNLPPFLQASIKAWIPQLKEWQKNEVIDLKTATDKQVVDFAKKSMEKIDKSKVLEASNPNLVTYLRLSGTLYEYLHMHPGSQSVPEILYYLSLCDRAIHNNFFFSLANIYLRECMLVYAQSEMAPKCYKEYEQEMILGYTGSSGTHLPDEVRQELSVLKKYIENKGKIELKGN